MTLIGIDLNASRARAVAGPRRGATAPLRLENDSHDLPLAVSLEERLPAVGRPGAALARKAPDLACLDFLPHLGDATVWAAGRHKLDAAAALELVFDDLRRRLPRAGAALALPAYLDDNQVALARRLAEKARWPLLGSVPAPLAAALAALGEGGDESLLTGWSGRALVLDVDGHALTCASVEIDDYQASLRHVHVARHLRRGAWLRRLLDGVAHRCVRLSRRDPRESADAEQALYDQLAHFVDHGGGPAPVVLHAQAGSWYQQLMLHPDELTALVAPLVREALAEVAAALTAAGAGAPAAVLLTRQAGRLPGLTAALDGRFPPAAEPAPKEADADDFGAGLLSDDDVRLARVQVLGADAVAQAAHEVAARAHGGDLAPGHHSAVPLAASPAGSVPDAGPARLSFRGQDHLLAGRPTFTLGRDPTCDLVFESELYPTVSARHCEVVFDRRAYTLCDRSRHGTLLNDQPVRQPAALHSGDWIRLGPSGPVLRFLGQSGGPRARA